jgi:ring-1,2-phenylacetyl-CoA epoxidase subunit PaaE
MGILRFLKKDKKTTRGFHTLSIAAIERLTTDTVKVTFDVPSDLTNQFLVEAGQYVNCLIEINGREERRSYSICSGKNEALSIAVKMIPAGKVSTWFNKEAAVGMSIQVSSPEGNFTLNAQEKNVVFIAAGSGITPILSLAKAIEERQGKAHLLYGNRTQASTIFAHELPTLSSLKVTHFLSNEIVEGAEYGRITNETFTAYIKENLALLGADAFYICGPEELILATAETLAFFGVAKTKIRYELFTTPILLKSATAEQASTFSGESNVTVILDSESKSFPLHSTGKTILDALERAGLDAPFSCRGGVCSSCKAKIITGKATMKMNYSLTDSEVKEGYILTCQAHPASDELTISFDE